MNDFDWWFSLLNISSKIKLKMLDQYKSTDNVWCELSKSSIYKEQYNKEKIDAIKRVIEEKSIKVVNFNDEKYPKNLKILEDAPFLIFYKGEIEKLNFGYNISIIGSRNCTNYGLSVTKIISKALAEHNIPVISGMAKGIDAQAHKSTIESGGYTCAVLGCGVDVIYPKENAKIYKEILENGCVISEFMPGTTPISFNFPIRNRIISALSEIIIVVEAGTKSGSLITVRLALDQGKNVMTVPGSIFSEQSKGTNQLIKDGAEPILSVQDIFSFAGLNLIETNTKIKNKEDNLNKLECKLNNIINNNPIHIDDIIKISNIDIKRVYELLFEMQFKNEILCLSGNYYVRINDKI
ncbi:MAG: DNA-protecting protein DprA [Clostridiaceae bacterium]|nr:DNA-protecting protein DprA [Clostridiaceae bacterium]